MKNRKLLLLLFVILGFFSSSLLSQNPSYQQKLYYSCKVWGYVKYFHSQVSICEVNWDSVLVSNLPKIKNAVTYNDFNDALDTLLLAAGPMAIAAYPYPNTIDPELRRNLDLEWFNDTVIRFDIKAKLDTIKENFWPHNICWVKKNNYTTGYYGWLILPHDTLMFNGNTSSIYPDEYTRLLLVFKYWNIIRYFNPNNYVTDVPWDSTLFTFLPSVVTANDDVEFFEVFRKIKARLDDAHAEGIKDFSTTNAFPCSYLHYFSPPLVLEYAEDHYVACKSAIAGISRGDIISTVDGKTTEQWEDSLRPYISAGNISIFRKLMCSYMMRGDSGSSIQIISKGILGGSHTTNTFRNFNFYKDTIITNYYPNDTLGQAKFRKWDCDVGYVNMGKLLVSDVDSMYNNLKTTQALIFDLRNYPNGTGPAIGNLIYPDHICYIKATCPEVLYPGTFYWHENYLGSYNNPSAYQGKVIVLCNERTMSQAEWNCMMLQAMPDAVVVGSQTAGTDGNITFLKISQNIPTFFTSIGMYYPNGDSTQRIGIVPDTVVYRTQDGIRQGRDEVLEKALQIISCALPVENQKPRTDQSIAIYPNPTYDRIHIECNLPFIEGVVSIYSLLGQLEFEAPIAKAKTELDLKGLSQGVYLIKIKSNEKTIVKKIVKE